MNISATRKVSGPSGSNRKVSSSPVSATSYSSAASEQMVESIDAANQVSVNPEARDEQARKEKFTPPRKDSEQARLSASQTYIPGAVEALAASGIYEEEANNRSRDKKVGVYGTNQTIVKDDAEIEQEKYYNENYLRHFYENNEPPEEVDELV